MKKSTSGFFGVEKSLSKNELPCQLRQLAITSQQIDDLKIGTSLKTKNGHLIKIDNNNFLLLKREPATSDPTSIYRVDPLEYEDSKLVESDRSVSKLGIIKAPKMEDSELVQHELDMLKLVNKTHPEAVSFKINDMTFIPMQDCGNANLDDSVTDYKQAPEKALLCLSRATKNLRELHEKQIFHNDITGGNIMYPSGELIDFELTVTSTKKPDGVVFEKIKANPAKDCKRLAEVADTLLSDLETHIAALESKSTALTDVIKSLREVSKDITVEQSVSLLKTLENILQTTASQLQAKSLENSQVSTEVPTFS